MKENSFKDQGYNLWVLLAQTRHAMLKARRKELAQYNIFAGWSPVLFAVQILGDNATPAEISRWLFRTPHAVSEILSRMEKAGLVKKVKDLDRKNMARVVLTVKGHEAFNQSIRRDSVHKIMSSLSREEYQQLMSCLQKLRDTALKELGIEGEIPFPLM